MNNDVKTPDQIIEDHINIIKQLFNEFLQFFENKDPLIDFSVMYYRLVNNLSSYHIGFQSEMTKSNSKHMIDILNDLIIKNPDVVDDEQLTDLKTGGNDQYSSWRKAKLEESIISNYGLNTLLEINKLQLDEKLRQRVMRWVLRGCNVKLALAKVQFDEKRNLEYQKFVKGNNPF